MRKIILTGAVLAMLTSVAPMVHAQIDTDVQQALDKKVNQDKYDAEIKKLEGEVGKVDGLDKKIDNIQQGLDNKITANKELIQGDNGKGGLKKELADLKSVVGEDDKKGLQKKVHELEKAKLGYDIAITSLNAVVNGDNGNIGLKKLLVGDDGNGGLKNDVKENKKLLVGADGKSGLQKDVGGLKGDIKKLQDAVGDDNSGLIKHVNDLEAQKESHKTAIQSLNAVVNGDNGSVGLKKVVGENENEGLRKAVKDNKEKIGKIEAMVNGQNDVKKDIAELGGRINVTGAMSAALAGLKPLQYDPMAPTQVMGSASTYEGQQAYALGLAHFTSEDLMVHGGVSFTNSHKYMANVGVTYKFGHSAEKSMIPMRYQAGPISSIYVMQKENEMMREKMAQQEERIAQLEEMIMNMKK